MSRKKKLTPAEAGERAVREDALAEAVKKKPITTLDLHEQVVKRLRGLTPAEAGEQAVREDALAEAVKKKSITT